MNLLKNVRHQIEEYESQVFGWRFYEKIVWFKHLVRLFKKHIQLKAEGKYILHPIGQFRQQFLRCSDNQWFAENYQVFVYPKCRYNLDEFVRADEFNVGNEIKKEIMIQESV